ncbi:3-oxoacyl-[acyl-carrier-protein] synthase III [Kytococcus aerolatus]|uniref:Beta-ketoacyl-[acyl-carrier-protein] synthase III n=1 Tax=Kytococcus aerolatus TaxID=592308 RepID=A0A212U2W3_9MICO|nr:beta-ketoacyl-ACP synthase III [Kytococcus aerolatus]SNC72466.1 3-oxoacyl-[acyl-carrier-protein] synthase III [Kytococcus aerolatus]
MPTDLRPASTGRAARIAGLGTHRGSRVVPNDELVAAIDSSDEWIRQRTGIEERRWVGPDETLLSMSVSAAGRAMDRAEVTADQIGAVLVATVSAPDRMPAIAPRVAEALGATCAAFDISAACAGYCYGIALANDLVTAGTADHVLVVGAEHLSQFLDPTDRGTAFIFGDGAGAAVVSLSEISGIAPVAWGSRGDKWELIRFGEDQTVAMEGRQVFRWAAWDMAPVARRALELAGITADELDAFIPHQANARITSEMVKQLGLAADLPVADDIRFSGNTSAASVPLATERMLTEGSAPSGGLALQIGFGAGLAYAAQVVRLP